MCCSSAGPWCCVLLVGALIDSVTAAGGSCSSGSKLPMRLALSESVPLHGLADDVAASEDGEADREIGLSSG